MGTRRRGYTTVEYAVLASVLVAALLAMQIYMKRGFSGRLRAASDAIGQAYAPRRTTSALAFDTTSKTLTDSRLVVFGEDKNGNGTFEADEIWVDVDQDGLPDTGMVTVTWIESDTTSRTGSETVGALSSEKLWE